MARTTAGKLASKTAAAAKKVTDSAKRTASATAAKATAPAKKAAATATKKTSAAKKSATTKTAAAKQTATKATAPAKKAATKAAAPAKKAAATASTKTAAAKKTATTKTAAAKKTATTKSAAAKKTATKATAPLAKAAAPRRTTTKAATAAATTGRKSTTVSHPKKSPTLAVKENEDPWTSAELDEVRAELVADRSRLQSELDLVTHELADLMRDAGDGAGNDQADVGSTTFERDHELTLVNNAKTLLLQTEHALERMDDGTYGVCESCGEPIGKMRLMAFPRATLCLSCKQREERR